jgi:hypothetical protein
LFELHETNRNAMALQLKYLLKKMDQFVKWLFLWKTKATTWEPWIATLLSMIDYESFKVLQVCKGTCF